MFFRSFSVYFFLFIHRTESAFILIDSSVKWIFGMESKYGFFSVARSMHNLYSEQSSLLKLGDHTREQWMESKKRRENNFGLPFSINHTHNCDSVGHVPTISCRLIDFNLNRGHRKKNLFIFAFDFTENVKSCLLFCFALSDFDWIELLKKNEEKIAW